MYAIIISYTTETMTSPFRSAFLQASPAVSFHSQRQAFCDTKAVRARRAKCATVPPRCCIPTDASHDTNIAAVVSEGSQGGLARQLRSEIERLAGSERGLFMASESIRAELDGHIRALESAVSPSFSPTDNKASLVDGNWRLLYTTLTILGRKRVRLAIATSQKPGFVRIGDITQSIDPVSSTSRSAVNFEVLAGGFKGYFEIIAGYEAVDPKRVEVKLQEWNLVPAKMAEILGEKKVGLLLQIFNPEGYLDITYADEDIRVGRDHNGNVFVLEKVTEV